MGYHISTTIIQNIDNIEDEQIILNKLGLVDYKFEGKTDFHNSVHTIENFFNIGFCKNHIIINDNHLFTELIYSDDLSDIEKKYMNLFPRSKILNVCCLGFNGFQAYHLIENGKRQRYMTSGDNYGFSEKFNPSLIWGLIPAKEKEIFELKESDFVNEITNCIMGFEVEYDENVSNTVFSRYRGDDLDYEDEEDEEISFNNTEIVKYIPLKKWWQF